MWPLINCLCLFTAFLSALLDNVTTLLLMGPVSIRLCEVMQLNPVPILVSMIIFSNIGKQKLSSSFEYIFCPKFPLKVCLILFLHAGGAITPVGDPPNIIIASNSHVIKNVSSNLYNCLSCNFIFYLFFPLSFITGRRFLNIHHSYVVGHNICDDSGIFAITFEIP